MTSVTRICQASGIYAPPLSDCRDALANVPKAYPNYLFAGSHDKACSVVGESGKCALTMCAFPGNAVKTSNYTAAVNDVLNKCQGTSSRDSSITVTGGYDIIKGTNFTFSVFGKYTPSSHFCTTNPGISPIYTDCSQLVNSLNQTSFYKQSSTTGCTTIKTVGTCSTNICAPVGTQLSGIEYFSALSNILGWCHPGDYVSGTQIFDNTFNVSVFAPPTVKRTPALSKVQISCDNDEGAPLLSDCTAVASAIKTKYPTTIKQTQANSGCSVVLRSGTCEAAFCANTGSTIATTDFLSAFKNVTDNCQSGVPGYGSNVVVGGHYRLQNSSVVATGIEPAKNIVCNTAANNSPLLSDCQSLIKGLDKTKIYQHVHDPCTVVSTSGTCKLNFCSPPNTTFTGQQLFDAATAIQSNCTSNMNYKTYTSGLYQINRYTNISLFDPPPTPGKIDYTVDEIRSMFLDPAYAQPQVNSCYFYIGKFKELAIKIVDDRNGNALGPNGAMSLYDFYASEGQDNYPFDPTLDPFLSYYKKDLERQWFQITSRAYAEVCTGTVYLVWDGAAPLMGSYSDGRSWKSIWLTDELNSYVTGVAKWTNIRQINPYTEEETNYSGPMSKRSLASSAKFLEARLNTTATPQGPKLEPRFRLSKRKHYDPCSYDTPSCDHQEENAFASPNIDGTAFLQDGSGWVPDACGFHITQYQKPNPATDSYRYVVTLKDSDGTAIGTGDFTLPSGQGASVFSPLPYTLDIRSGNVDADPVYWAYAGYSSDTSQSVCSQGKYDSGKREIDCGFTCS